VILELHRETIVMYNSKCFYLLLLSQLSFLCPSLNWRKAEFYALLSKKIVELWLV
jgi:hypothetical protein